MEDLRLNLNTLSNSCFLSFSHPSEVTHVRLFAFPYAGGSASIFRPWVKTLNIPLEIIGVQLPGRETRFKESPIHNLTPLIEDILKGFSPYFDKPFILFGHSVGALISFEFVRALRRKNYPMPQHLIVSGTKAPHLPLRRKKIHYLPDEEFIAELSSYNGIPSILRENLELLELFIPTIRADFSLSETYSYCEESPLSCPISAFGGVGDPYVTLEDVSAWHSHTQNHFKEYLFKGDHFFLTKDSYNDVISTLSQIISTEIEKLS